jgi:predicted metal-binding protein
MKDHVRSHWDAALLVCGKCSKKVGGGFGPRGKRSLTKALRDEPGFGKGRKAAIGVVETRCLGICPKGAVTLVDSRRPGRWRIVPAGADVTALTQLLDQEAVAQPAE